MKKPQKMERMPRSQINYENNKVLYLKIQSTNKYIAQIKAILFLICPPGKINARIFILSDYIGLILIAVLRLKRETEGEKNIVL